MDRVLSFVLLGALLSSVVTSRSICKITEDRSTASSVSRCTSLKNVGILNQMKNRATTIEIAYSQIQHLPGYAFTKFARTLKKLDLHGIGIEVMDNNTFWGLTNLQELILWGNKLQLVYGDWFANTTNLRTLDVSFNRIQVIEYKVFQNLPNLENFYFDYNEIKFFDYSMLAYLKNLKNVKFGKNPLNWGYRAHLTWQLDNQKVRHEEEWEDWAWLNAMIKECAASGHGEIPSDTILDCVVGKLLDFANEIFSTEAIQQNYSCDVNAAQAVKCMRPWNVTVDTDNETVRRILQSYVGVFAPMTKTLGRFPMRFVQ